MTDDEKERVEGLLDDLDTLPEILDENLDITASSVCVLNPTVFIIKMNNNFFV